MPQESFKDGHDGWKTASTDGHRYGKTVFATCTIGTSKTHEGTSRAVVVLPAQSAMQSTLSWSVSVGQIPFGKTVFARVVEDSPREAASAATWALMGIALERGHGFEEGTFVRRLSRWELGTLTRWSLITINRPIIVRFRSLIRSNSPIIDYFRSHRDLQQCNY